MAGALRFLLALAALPLAWSVARSLVDMLGSIPAEGRAVVPAGVVAVFAGLVAQLAVWKFLPPPVRAYVFGHELTHALWGLLFGARVSKLRVGASGGSVTLSKSNVWITLAPYFFPFYTAVVALAALVVRCFASPLPLPCAWLFAVGFTWCFHCCFTIRSLLQPQPDIKEYGRLFSYVLIWVFNVAGVAAWIVCTAGIPWTAFARSLLSRAANAYLSVGSSAAWLSESLRALLRG